MRSQAARAVAHRAGAGGVMSLMGHVLLIGVAGARSTMRCAAGGYGLGERFAGDSG